MHEADQVVVVDDVLAPHQERADVPAPILDDAHVHVVGQVLARPLHQLRLLLGTDGEDEVRPLGHGPGVGERGLQEVHVVQVRDEGDLLRLGLAGHRLRGQDVGELEILDQVRHVHGAQGVVPDEVRVKVGVVAQVLVELHGRVTHGLVKHVLVAVEEGAALEDGAAPLRNELLGGEEDGLQGEALQVLSIDIHVGGEAQPLEALGEGRLVEPYGILV